MRLSELDLEGAFDGFDVWSKEIFKNIKKIKVDIASHETNVWRLRRGR